MLGAPHKKQNHEQKQSPLIASPFEAHLFAEARMLLLLAHVNYDKPGAKLGLKSKSVFSGEK